MSGALFQVGVDHHLAPLAVREHMALSPDAADAAARAIHAEGWAQEVILLSTCNRTELYAASEDAGDELALGAMLRHVQGAPDPTRGCYRRQNGDAAAQHLLRVACGLESAILGETEIQGQVREAHARGRAAATVGPVLDRLCQAAMRAGKRARRETKISDGGISHGHAAVQVVRRVFDTLEGRAVLILGAGHVAAQAARALADAQGGAYVVANRTPEHAQAIADLLPGGARITGLDALPHELARAHVAILATGAEPLAVADVAAVLRKRREPLLLVDLGVPRCVDAAASELPGVFLYDIEDLEGMVAGALAARREAVPMVEALIADELGTFRSWHRGHAAAPTIRSLHAWAEAIRRAELAHLPADLPPATRAAVEEVTERLVRRLLGRAAARVVKGTGGDDPDMPTADHLRSVFGLDEGDSK